MIVGKAIGVLGGFATGFFPEGILAGLIAGIYLDEWYLKRQLVQSRGSYWMQEFSVCFLQILGIIASAKGHVGRDDIARIRDAAYVPAEHKELANRILKHAKKNKLSFEVLLNKMQNLCEGEPDMLTLVASAALHVGQAQGEAGRRMVEAMHRMWGYPAVNWQKVSYNTHTHAGARDSAGAGSSAFEGGAKGGAKQKSQKQKGRDEQKSYTDDDPLVTHAFGKKNPYQVLGLKEGASAADVKKAYRRLIQKYHPDRVQAEGGGTKAIEKAEDKMAEVNAAYDYINKKNTPLT